MAITLKKLSSIVARKAVKAVYLKTMEMMSLKNIADRLSILTKSIIPFKTIPPYWVKITTARPDCVYYFGSFDSRIEAKKMSQGYIQDLMEEKAIGISVSIKRYSPTELTVVNE